MTVEAKYKIADIEDLLKVLARYPTARIVTGQSTFQGRGDLKSAIVHDDGKRPVVELIFK